MLNLRIVIHHLFYYSFPASPIPIPPTAPVPPLPPSNATSPNSSLPDSCHSVITPTCLQDLYSIPKTPATQQSNKLFVSGFSGQWANKADLTTFLKKNRPDLSANTSFALISVANGTNPQKGYDAGIEANLDIQYTTGIASGVPISFVSVGPTDTETDKEFFVALQDEANALLTMKTPPTVLTSSYSLNENLISQSLAKSVVLSVEYDNTLANAPLQVNLQPVYATRCSRCLGAVFERRWRCVHRCAFNAASYSNQCF